MDFIETLKSVGGIKPCTRCHVEILPECCYCHGTGQVLDLAPLLAKPRCFIPVVSELIEKSEQRSVCTDISLVGQLYEAPQPLYIVGPQRAHSLVYEVARQLGGTAVVAFTVERTVDTGIGVIPDTYTELSLAIPPAATVLFVADRLTKQDEEWVMRALNSPSAGSPGVPLYETVKYLDYVLCLVSEVTSFGIFCGPGHSPGKLISLHQEKP